MKQILSFALLLMMCGQAAYADFMSLANPANPTSLLNPANPANPASPLSPLRLSSTGSTTKSNDLESKQVGYRGYEYYVDCIKQHGADYCKAYNCSGDDVRHCQYYGGGSACMSTPKIKSQYERCIQYGGGNSCRQFK